jgi:hypothetical protein
MPTQNDPFRPQQVTDPTFRDGVLLTERRCLFSGSVTSNELVDCLGRQTTPNFAVEHRWFYVRDRLEWEPAGETGEFGYLVRSRRQQS